MADEKKRGPGRPPGKHGPYLKGVLYEEVVFEVYKMHGYKPGDKIPEEYEEYVLNNVFVFAKKLPRKMNIAFVMRYRENCDEEGNDIEKQPSYKEIGRILRVDADGNPDPMSEAGVRKWVTRARERIIKKLNNGLHKLKAEKNGS